MLPRRRPVPEQKARTRWISQACGTISTERTSENREATFLIVSMLKTSEEVSVWDTASWRRRSTLRQEINFPTHERYDCRAMNESHVKRETRGRAPSAFRGPHRALAQEGLRGRTEGFEATLFDPRAVVQSGLAPERLPRRVTRRSTRRGELKMALFHVRKLLQQLQTRDYQHLPRATRAYPQLPRMALLPAPKSTPTRKAPPYCAAALVRGRNKC